MAQTRDMLLLLAAAVLIRGVLFALFPGLPDLLADRVEVSTPVTSYKRLQEGVFLFNHGISPYNGGVYHQSPILLAIFSLFPNWSLAVGAPLLYTLADLLAAGALVRIAQSGQSRSTRLFTSTRLDSSWTPIAVAAAYLFNPLTIANCLGRPTSIFTNVMILQAVAAAVEANATLSACCLALGAQLSIYPILLAPPVALLAYDCSMLRSQKATHAIQYFSTWGLSFVVSSGLLMLLSWFLMDFSDEFFRATYGVQLMVTDLTPNIGLWWYFFIEMFDSFRSFFLAVFWLHMSSYMGGLLIRIRKQPLFVITSLLGIFAIYKPYPSISDLSLYLSLLPLYRHLFPLFRYGFIATAALLYATFLGPAFWHLWVYAGSGNANFYYAITLVWSLGQTIMVADGIYAVLRDELDAERPELQGKEVRQI